jgi:hypothetical protein
VARSVESRDGMGPEPKFDKSRYWNPEASKLTWLAIDIISPRDIAQGGRDRSSVVEGLTLKRQDISHSISPIY